MWPHRKKSGGCCTRLIYNCIHNNCHTRCQGAAPELLVDLSLQHMGHVSVAADSFQWIGYFIWGFTARDTVNTDDLEICASLYVLSLLWPTLPSKTQLECKPQAKSFSKSMPLTWISRKPLPNKTSLLLIFVLVTEQDTRMKLVCTSAVRERGMFMLSTHM